VRALGKPAYESDIGSHQHDTFFLGAFTKLRKATISFVMSVCLSVRLYAWNSSALNERIFVKFDISVYSKVRPKNQSFINIS